MQLNVTNTIYPQEKEELFKRITISQPAVY